jgi:monofunctional biosynthetic peptidoglycan transglycosylase
MRAVRTILIVAVVIVLLPYLLAPFYRSGHPFSTLMLWRMATGSPVDRRWLDLNEFAGSLAPTVIAAEDAKYCSHDGIDWDSLRGAIEDAQDGEVSGGGSTITQQVAKNLFLWPGRSFTRKGLEIPLALWLNAVLSKPRILEIYLNVAEWGPKGQFGAEAGAQNAFGRSAFAISPSQSALLAAILPNPVTRSAAKPSAAVQRRAGIYLARARTPDLTDCLGRPGNGDR